jgi:hypothetical protein
LSSDTVSPAAARRAAVSWTLPIASYSYSPRCSVVRLVMCQRSTRPSRNSLLMR